jgi:hypothetical protein
MPGETMPKRTVITEPSGKTQTKVEPHDCEIKQLEKGDQAADKAWSNKQTKADKKPAAQKVINNEVK